MRLFVGIPLAPAVVEELSAIALRLQAKDDGLRWSAPESWHITLQFLGNTAEYECIVARLHELRAAPVPSNWRVWASLSAPVFFLRV
jgi:RNA 2',3'-cyclic 3'-phosphodiesterase